MTQLGGHTRSRDLDNAAVVLSAGGGVDVSLGIDSQAGKRAAGEAKGACPDHRSKAR